MAALAPLRTLVETRRGRPVRLPPELSRIYGSFRLPGSGHRPHVLTNAVTTLDGVVSLDVDGHASGGDISGRNGHDRLVMGLLRAVADVIVVGAGTLRVDRETVWTAEEIFPDLAEEFRE